MAILSLSAALILQQTTDTTTILTETELTFLLGVYIEDDSQLAQMNSKVLLGVYIEGGDNKDSWRG